MITRRRALAVFVQAVLIVLVVEAGKHLHGEALAAYYGGAVGVLLMCALWYAGQRRRR